ncbi:MAG: phospho-N-acetylmuramoyl-pentapeptide-transferase [Candidatus Dasytiphilus stammeri]
MLFFLMMHFNIWNRLLNLTIRAFATFITAFLISLLIGPWLIRVLQKLNFGQIVREHGPKSHVYKTNTPTMGGIMILSSIMISVLLWGKITDAYIWCLLFVLIGYGIIGFIDDYLKIIHQNSQGLIVYWKYIWESIITLFIIFIFYFIENHTIAIQIIEPLFKKNISSLDIKNFFLPYFVIIGTSNAVNITDGLDGLAIMLIILVAIGFAIIAAISSNNIHYCFNYLNFHEITIFCSAIIGAGLGFLWFNTYPAQIFMGDTGSLALGSVLGTIAVLLKKELLLILMGVVFVIETLSVIIQIVHFKINGKRIFTMAPLHHHYELKGCPEPRIIVRFWIINLIFILIALVFFKLHND